MTPDNIDTEALRELDIRGRIRDCAISGDGSHLDDVADAWEVLLAMVEAQRKEIERAHAKISEKAEECSALERESHGLGRCVDQLSRDAFSAATERDALKAEVERLRDAMERERPSSPTFTCSECCGPSAILLDGRCIPCDERAALRGEEASRG